MKLYNNDPAFGGGGPYEVSTVEELIEDLAESIRTWAQAAHEADAVKGPGTEFIPPLADYVTYAESELRAALSVVCSRCGEHGPIGNLDWVCGDHY